MRSKLWKSDVRVEKREGQLDGNASKSGENEEEELRMTRREGRQKLGVKRTSFTLVGAVRTCTETGNRRGGRKTQRSQQLRHREKKEWEERGIRQTNCIAVYKWGEEKGTQGQWGWGKKVTHRTTVD